MSLSAFFTKEWKKTKSNSSEKKIIQINGKSLKTCDWTNVCALCVCMCVMCVWVNLAHCCYEPTNTMYIIMYYYIHRSAVHMIYSKHLSLLCSLPQSLPTPLLAHRQSTQTPKCTSILIDKYSGSVFSLLASHFHSHHIKILWALLSVWKKFTFVCVIRVFFVPLLYTNQSNSVHTTENICTEYARCTEFFRKN